MYGKPLCWFLSGERVKIPETFAESSRKSPPSIVYNFGRFHESALANSQGGIL